MMQTKYFLSCVRINGDLGPQNLEKEGSGFNRLCSRKGSFPVAQQVKNLPVIQETLETHVRSLGPDDTLIPWRKKWQTTPVFLPGKLL